MEKTKELINGNVFIQITPSLPVESILLILGSDLAEEKNLIDRWADKNHCQNQ